MKKLILIVVALVVVVGIIRTVRQNDAPDQAAAPSPSTTTEQSGDVAVITVLAAKVDVLRTNGTSVTASNGTTVTQGDTITTSSSGRALVTYPNGTISVIGENSTVVIAELADDGNQSQMNLVGGSMWSKVKKLTGTDAHYEVQTDQTVASVRGTIFFTEVKNRRTSVFGIQHAVNVRTKIKTPAQTTAPDDSVDLASGEMVTLDDSTPAPTRARLAALKRVMTDEDMRRPFLKTMMSETVEQKDLDETSVRALYVRSLKANKTDRAFVRELIKRRLVEEKDVRDVDPLLLESASPAPSTTPRPSTTASPSRTPVPSPTSSATPSSSATPTPTPTSDTGIILESVFPRLVKRGEQFAVNGRNFTAGRNIKQVQSVKIGTTSSTFSVIDSLTMFVTADASITPGTYDVSVTSITGVTATLPRAIEIQ